jgi:DNA-directed RNA polymerase specialized sigma24 family protein
VNRNGGAMTAAAEPLNQALYERLHAQRKDFELNVTARFPGTFGRADAEDFVSEALERVLVTTALPADRSEEAWFRSVVHNMAIDELRRRRGRPGGATRSGGLREVVLLSELAEHGQEPADQQADPEQVLEALDQPTIQAEWRMRARAVLDGLDPEDAALLDICHVQLPGAGRTKWAQRAGMSVDTWRYRYPRAWERFVEEMAAAEPTTQCRSIRDMIGQLDAGSLSNGAALSARGRVEAHIDGCIACRVFARDSYRILALTPAVPAGAVAVTAGGAAAGGAGLAALIGAGGLKAVAVVCGISITAAGICGGVIATIDALDNPPKQERIADSPEPRTKPVVLQRTPVPTPVSTPRPEPTREPRPRTASAKQRGAAIDRERRSTPPAAVAPSSTGDEFSPVPVQAQVPPAPAPAGGGEFAP